MVSSLVLILSAALLSVSAQTVQPQVKKPEENILPALIECVGKGNPDEPEIYWGHGPIGDDTLQKVYWGDESSEETHVSEDDGVIGVMKFLSDAYESHDFYQSGYWGMREEELSSDIYDGSLPPMHPDVMKSPAKGRITSRFGWRQRFQRLHKGIDIALTVGDTVRCAMDGIVSHVSFDREGYGRYVVVKHDNGMETRYGHLSASLVRPGDKVAVGDPIALGGNTGNSNGPHLHFETRYNGLPFDPARLFRF